MPLKTWSLFFNNHYRKLPIPFVVYADFKCLTKPIDNCEPDSNYSFAMEYHKREPSGFCLYLKGLDRIKTYLNLQDYNPLSNDTLVLCEDDELISVTTDSVVTRLSKISTSRAGGPDDLPNRVLKKFSDILAPVLTEVLNQSFQESKVPRTWKLADVPPVPNGLYWRL